MLNEERKIDRIEIIENGSIQIRELIVIYKEGSELTRTFNRYVLEPGSNVEEMPEKIKGICKIIWTDDIIEQFEENKQNST